MPRTADVHRLFNELHKALDDQATHIHNTASNLNLEVRLSNLASRIDAAHHDYADLHDDLPA